MWVADSQSLPFRAEWQRQGQLGSERDFLAGQNIQSAEDSEGPLTAVLRSSLGLPLLVLPRFVGLSPPGTFASSLFHFQAKLLLHPKTLVGTLSDYKILSCSGSTSVQRKNLLERPRGTAHTLNLS